MTTFERRVEITPAYDKRSTDPKKNYGIGGCTVRFLLIGPRGAMQFVVLTEWYLPHVKRELNHKGQLDTLRYPMAFDLGYHSPKPMYEGQSPMENECDVLGGQCYYDVTTLGAEPIVDVMLREGSEGVWRELEQQYEIRFGELAEAGER